MNALANLSGIDLGAGWGAGIALLVRLTLLLLAVALIHRALPRAAAALRHQVVVAGLLAAMVLPVLSWLLPPLRLPVLPVVSSGGMNAAPPAVGARHAVPVPDFGNEVSPGSAEGMSRQQVEILRPQSTPAVPARAPRAVARPADATVVGTPATTRWLAVVWLLGAVTLLARLVVSSVRAHRLVATARPWPEAAPALADASAALGVASLPRLLVSEAVAVPMVFGLRRPVLLLPAGATAWSAERLRVVLLHELAHVVRGDAWWLLVGRLATALYWFHPLAWRLERAARHERELACDARAVAVGGVRPSDYATHLLALAADLRARVSAPGVALAMARPSRLEERLTAILRPRPTAATSRAFPVVALGVLALLLPLASVRLAAVSAFGVESMHLGGGLTPPLEIATPAVEVRRVQRVEVESAVRRERVVLAKNDRDGDREARRRVRAEREEARERDQEAGERAYDRAWEAHRDDRYQASAEGFARAWELGYRPGTSAYNAACAHALLGATEEALAWLERAFFEEDFSRADLLWEDSDLDPIRADSRFRALLDRVAEDRGGRFRRGRGPDRLEEAEEELAALEVDRSTDGEDWYEVGTQLLSLRQLEPAKRALERATELLGDDASSAHYNLACAQAIGGEVDAALVSLGRAIEAGYGNAAHLAEDPDLRRLHGDPRFDALVERTEAFDFGPSHWGCGKWCGDDGFSARRWKPAVEHFQRMVDAEPASGRAWFSLGWALHYATEHARAVTAFERAAELGYRAATSRYNVACAHAMNGAVDAAFAALDAAFAADPEIGHHLWDDPDLDRLRDDPRFDALLDRAEDAEDKWERRHLYRRHVDDRD